jgi:hypothetical protein
MRPRLPLLLAAAAALAGCAAGGDYPSLALRPSENEDWTQAPVRAEPRVADDPALQRRLGELVAEAQAGARAFGADLPAARAAMAHAGAQGSESWVVAQQAYSRLEAARGRTDAAADQLQQLRVQRAGAATSAADLAAIDAAIAAVAALQGRQQGEMDRLSRP